MTSPDQQPHPVDMWAICDPQGNIMDSTVMLKQKDAIYNGTVWGRCGDDRTLADFKREGYRVIRVHVVPFSAPKNDPATIAAAARAEERERLRKETESPLYWCVGRIETTMRDNHCVRPELDGIIPRLKQIAEALRSQQPVGEDGGAG